MIKPSGRLLGAKNKKKCTSQQAFKKSIQREPFRFQHVLRQQRHQEVTTTAGQVTDQEDMIAAVEFFGITGLIITREGSAIRGVTRGVTRGGRQRGITRPTYMEGNEVMFNSFQL